LDTGGAKPENAAKLQAKFMILSPWQTTPEIDPLLSRHLQ
jgi:hypothetical protein